MGTDDSAKAGEEAFKREFADKKKLDESIEQAIEEMAPSEFAHKKSDELRQGSAALEEGGHQLEAMAERKGGTLTADEVAEERGIEAGGDAVASEGAAKMSAVASEGAVREIPPPLPSKAETPPTLDTLVAAELAGIAERDGKMEGPPQQASEEGPAGKKAERTENAAELADVSRRLKEIGFEGDPKEFHEKHGTNAELQVLGMEVKHYRAKMAGLEAQSKKFDGIAGRLKRTFNKEEYQKVQEELAEVSAIYREVRAEFVGGKAERFMQERIDLLDARIGNLSKEKGIGGRIKEAYKWLGDQNLESLFKKLAQGDEGSRSARLAKWFLADKKWVGQRVLRAASLRTLIGGGLVGASFLAGGGAGLAAFGASRAFRAAGSSILAYDTMRAVANRERVLSVESRLAGGFGSKRLGITKESAEAKDRKIMETMTNDEIIEYLDAAEARALTGGKSPNEDETYKKMSALLASRMESHKETVLADRSPEQQEQAADAMASNLSEMMRASDERLKTLQAKRESNRRATAIAAVGIGAILGTVGLGSKLEAYQTAKDAAAMQAAEQKGAAVIAAAQERAAAVPPERLLKSPIEAFREAHGDKMLEAARLNKGEGLTHMIRDQLKVDPQEFGYDPKIHGNLDRWATLKSAEIARQNGMLASTSELRPEFNPSNPDQFAFLEKTPDGKFAVQLQGIETKVFTRPTDLEFGGAEGAGKWTAHIEYSRNGLPKGFSIDTAELPGKAELADAYSGNDELAGRLANRGNITTLLNTESGDQYQKWFGRVHQEQALLENLRTSGQGGSRLARMLEDSVDRKLEILNRAMGEGELVRFEGADAGENIKQYMGTFAARGVARESLEQLAYAEEGMGRVGLIDSAGSTITVDVSMQAKEAAWRQLTAIRENISSSSGVDFVYDQEAGNVAGYSQESLLGVDKAIREMRLRPEFMSILKDEGLSPAEQLRVDVLVRAIATENSAIRNLMDTRLIDTPERSFLEASVLQKSRELKDIIGDAEVWRAPSAEQVARGAETARALSLKVEMPSLSQLQASLSEQLPGGEALGASTAEQTEVLRASNLSSETLRHVASGEHGAGPLELMDREGVVYTVDPVDPDVMKAARAALEERGTTGAGAELVSGDLGDRAEVLVELSPKGADEVARDVASGSYGSLNAQEMKLGLSWIEQDVSAEDLKKLAEGGAVRGDLEAFSGGVVHETGYEAKRAARYALQKLAERARERDI